MDADHRRTTRWIKSLLPEPALRLARRLLPDSALGFARRVFQSNVFSGLESSLARGAAEKIRATSSAFSPSQLADDLRAGGLPAGATVFVHSSLSRLGFVEDGAEGVLEALRLAVGADGTIAVPTFTMNGSMYETLRLGEVFDVRTTPSRMGQITEAVRRDPAARRSVHPTHSVAAIGPGATRLTESHHRASRAFGDQSPWGRLLAADGYVLGLGIDLGPVTFYHAVEDLEPSFPHRVYSHDSPLSARCIAGDGVEVTVEVMAQDPGQATVRIDKPTGTAVRAYVTQHLMKHNGLKTFKVGGGTGWLIRSRSFYDGVAALARGGITIYADEHAIRGAS